MMFTGCGTALVTPFSGDGELDLAAFRRLVRRQIDGGVQFLVPCGTTGECPTLTLEERRTIISVTLEEAAGKLPVMAGAGGYDTYQVIDEALAWKDLGVQGILSVTPYYNKPTQEGLYQHYSAIAQAVQLPVLMYNVPGRTGVNLEPATALRLAQVPHIAGVKEASGNISQIAALCAKAPEGFLVLSGDDAVTLPLLALGGKGLISVASNEIPDVMAKLCTAGLSGDFATARALQAQYFDLMEANFMEANPIPVKMALSMMGLCDPIWRLPMTPPAPATQEKLRVILQRHQLVS